MFSISIIKNTLFSVYIKQKLCLDANSGGVFSYSFKGFPI